MEPGEGRITTVIIGNTGLMKKSLKTYLERIPGKINTGQLQLEATRGTVSVLKIALG